MTSLRCPWLCVQVGATAVTRRVTERRLRTRAGTGGMLRVWLPLARPRLTTPCNTLRTTSEYTGLVGRVACASAAWGPRLIANQQRNAARCCSVPTMSLGGACGGGFRWFRESLETTVSDLLEGLASDGVRFRSKRDRRAQRMAFRDFLKGFEASSVVCVFGHCLCAGVCSCHRPSAISFVCLPCPLLHWPVALA